MIIPNTNTSTLVSSASLESSDFGNKSPNLDHGDIAGIIIGVFTVVIAILALFKGYKCWSSQWRTAYVRIAQIYLHRPKTFSLSVQRFTKPFITFHII